MGIELLISIGLCVIVLLAVIFIIARDKEVNKRLVILEKVIEDLNQQNHKLNKSVKAKDSDIQKILEDEFKNKVVPLTQSLQEVKKITQSFRETKIKDISAKDDFDYEKGVLELYKNGRNESDIARILGLEVRQVELILSLNDTE